MATWRGVPTPNRRTPARLSIACAARGRSRGQGPSLRLRPEYARLRVCEDSMKHDPEQSPYYSELGRLSFSPGWARPEPSMWPEPKPKFKPAVWRFADAKKALDASHNMVPAEQTERRNLIMVNPIEGNTYATTRHLVAAYQCVMAGDKARTHRHSAAALRLVLKGKPGIYTVVNGARIDMAPGDVVLTPAFSWHGHANESDETGYWIDFLDIPFIQL